MTTDGARRGWTQLRRVQPARRVGIWLRTWDRQRLLRLWTRSAGVRAGVIALAATLLVWGACLSSRATLSPAAQITTINPDCRVAGPQLACQALYSPITMEDPAATAWQNMPQDYYYQHARQLGQGRPSWDPYRGSGYPIALDGLNSPFSLPQWFQSRLPGDQGRDIVALARFALWTFGITWTVALWGASALLLCGVALTATLAPYGAIYTDIVFLDVDLLSPWFVLILMSLVTGRISSRAAWLWSAGLGVLVGSLAFQQSQLVLCAALGLVSLMAAPFTRGRSLIAGLCLGLGVISVVPAWLPLARNFGEFISSRTVLCIAAEGTDWSVFWSGVLTPRLVQDRSLFLTLVGAVVALYVPTRARFTLLALLAMGAWQIAGLPALVCKLPVVSGLRFSRHLVPCLQMLFIVSVGIAIAARSRRLARRPSWLLLAVAQTGAMFVLKGMPLGVAADWVTRSCLMGAGLALLAALLYAPGPAAYRRTLARWCYDLSLLAAVFPPLLFASSLPLRLLETSVGTPEVTPLPAAIDASTPIGRVQKLTAEQDRRHYSPTGYISTNWGEALRIMELLSVHAFYPKAYHELNAGLFQGWFRDPFHGLVPDRFVPVHHSLVWTTEFQRVLAVHRVSLLTFKLGTASFARDTSPYAASRCQLLGRHAQQVTESYVCPDVGGVGFFPKQVQRVASHAEAITHLNKLTPREILDTALVGPEVAPSAGRTLDPAVGEVVHVERAGDELVYTLKVAQAGIFVIADTYFPGWTAFVNGQRVGISRANVNFKAVHVPAGDTTLQLQFSPRLFGDDPQP